MNAPKLSEALLHKFVRALEAEEVDMYSLGLYSMNNAELHYFSPADRKRAVTIFKTLVEDTRQHIDLLKLIVELGGG